MVDWSKYSEDSIHDMFHGWWHNEKINNDFLYVRDKFLDYEDDIQITEHIVQHKESGKFYKWIQHYNSWEGDVEPFNVEDIIEVKPIEVMVIEYIPI